MSATDTRFMRVVSSLRMSPAVIAVYAVASVVGGLISVTSATGATWLLVALVGAVTGTAVAFLIIATALPWSRFAHRPVMLTVVFIGTAGVAGAVRGLVFVELARTWGVQLNSDDVAQVANSIVAAVVWLVLAGLVIGSRSRYRDRYRALLLQSQPGIDWDRHPSIEQVKRNVGTALSVSEVSPHVDPRQVADAIRCEIDTNIRPLSHRLWFGSEDEEPRSRLLPLIRDAVTSWTVPVRVVTSVWFLTAILGAGRWLGFEQGLVASAMSTLLIVTLIVVVGRLTPAVFGWRVAALTIGSFVVVVATDGVLRVFGYPSRLYLDTGSLFLVPLTIVALVLVSAAISLVESDRRMILEVAERESREVVSLRHQSAFLHNSLQSELTGLALQLEQAARSGSDEQSKAALERVHALLARSISEDFTSFQENPRERVDRVVNGWRGICEVSIDLPESALGDPRLSVAVQAIEEIVANAVRHAGASRIRLGVFVEERGLVIEGESNARVVTRPDPDNTGIGSRVLTALAPRGITLETTDSGSRVQLVVP